MPPCDGPPRSAGTAAGAANSGGADITGSVASSREILIRDSGTSPRATLFIPSMLSSEALKAGPGDALCYIETSDKHAFDEGSSF